MSELCKLDIKNFLSFNETLFNIELSYQLFGKPIGDAPIVMVNHALTGNSSVCGKDGWWDPIVGKNKLINTDKFTVIAFNFPGNGFDKVVIKNYKELILADVAKIFKIGLEKLKISKLHAVIGGSIGGCLIWELAFLYPNLSENYIPIASDWKSTNWLISMTRVQKQILKNSRKPLQDARIHAMLSYRSPKSINLKFDRNIEKNKFNVENWLLYHGDKLNRRYDLNSYKLMNHLLSTVNITKNVKLFSLATKINSNIYIVSIDSDLLFTHEENKITFDEISKYKKNVFLKTIISDHGHDAFLMEFRKIKDLLHEVFI
ncbi:MAG: homoserine acetyltransferase [Flavobacteriaceae bacterium]|nr:homoserine acetyltransferase [Flavobacteriaceae bacterium]